MIEPLYQLEKDGKLSADGERGLLGRNFLAGQLINAAQMLGGSCYSSWEQAPLDTNLGSQSLKSKASNGHPAPHSSARIPEKNLEN